MWLCVYFIHVYVGAWMSFEPLIKKNCALMSCVFLATSTTKFRLQKMLKQCPIGWRTIHFDATCCVGHSMFGGLHGALDVHLHRHLCLDEGSSRSFSHDDRICNQGCANGHDRVFGRHIIMDMMLLHLSLTWCDNYSHVLFICCNIDLGQ